MDFKLLKPDFNALGKTDWAKPQIDTKNIFALAGTIAAALMVVFVFCPWFGVEAGSLTRSLASEMGESADNTVTRLGITLWYGIIGLIAAVAALVGNLYNQKPLAFWGGVLGALMGLLGLFMYASLTKDGETIEADMLKLAVSTGVMDTIRWGATLFFISSLVAAATAFANVMGLKK